MNKSSGVNHHLLSGILTLLLFLAFRATMPFIADEDLMLASIITNKVSIFDAFSVGCNFTEFKSIPIFFGNNLIEFRPLSIFFGNNMAYFFSVNEKMAFIFAVFLLGSLIGVVSTVIFDITFKISKNFYVSYGAVFINLFSSIFLTGAFLYLFALFYIIPHFFNILAFFFYLRYVSNRNSEKYLFYLSVCCFVGPLFREAGLIAPLSIVLSELFRHILCFFKKSETRPSLKSGLLFLVLFFHSVVPKSIFYILGIYDGKFTTIFGGEKLINTNASLALNLSRFLQILLEFPSSLWIVFLFGLAFLVQKFVARKKYFLPTNFSAIIEDNSPCRLGIIIPIFLVFLIIFLCSFLNAAVAVLLFCVIFLVSFLAINPYLTLLTVVSLLPALFIQSNHLIADIFFITPFSVIFSIGIYLAYVVSKKMGRVAKLSLIIIFFISSCDFAANYFSSYFSMKNINKRHQEIALEMKDVVPTDALVITNFFAGRDIIVKHDQYKASDDLNFYLYDRNNELFSLVFHKDKKREMLKELRVNLLEKEKGKDIYFLLIKSQNGDHPLYLPHTKMEMLRTYDIENFTLHLDPLRHFIFNRKFLGRFNPQINFLPESRVFPQYDTSYNNYSDDNCCVSNSKIGLYKLSHKLFNSLDEDDLKFGRFDKFDKMVLEN